MSSVAEKARMMNGWMMIKVEMNIRFRLWGSCCRWPWLAIIMRGETSRRVLRGELRFGLCLFRGLGFLWGSMMGLVSVG